MTSRTRAWAVAAAATIVLSAAPSHAAVLRTPAAEVCKLPAQNGQPAIDLSSLGKSESDYKVASVDYKGYEFVLNICHELVFTDARCTKGATVCERHSANRIGTDIYGTLASSELAWVREEEKTDLVLTAKGGMCSADQSKQFQSRLFFNCDKSAVAPVIKVKAESFYGCYVELYVNTVLACAGHPPPPPPAGDHYVCNHETCVEAPSGGFPKATCEAMCGPPSPGPPPPSPGPPPPSPGPPPPPSPVGPDYRCEKGLCVETKEGGTSKENCEAFCFAPNPPSPGPPPPSPGPTPPAPPDTYHCDRGACVLAKEGGIPKAECTALCGPPAPSPPPVADHYKCVHGKCVASESGGVSKAECETVCEPEPPTALYKCASDKCAEVAAGEKGVPLNVCQQLCAAQPNVEEL